MRSFYLFLISLFSVTQVSANILPAHVLMQYFKSYNLDTVYFSLCEKGNKVNILRQLSMNGMSLSFAAESLNMPPDFRIGGVIDVRCSYGRYILQKMSELKLINAHSEWLLLGSTNTTAEDISEIYALPSSCVILAKVDETEATYYDIWRPSMFTPLKMNLVSVQPLESFTPLPRRLPRKDFGGITLRAAVVIMYTGSFDGLESPNYSEFDVAAKLSYPISKTLWEQLNFKITLVSVDDYGWGKINGQPAGLFGMVLREEIDLGITPFYMRDERVRGVDFTGDVFDLNSKVIFKQPALPTVANIFVLPFSTPVWICCGVVCVLTAVLLRLDAAITLMERKPFLHPLSFGEAIVLVIGQISQQGSSVIPICASCKTTVFAFSLAALFLYTSYSATIVRLLQSASHSINSIADLTKSHLTVIVQNISYNKPFFEETQDKDEHDLYYKKVLPQGEEAYFFPEDGVKLIRSGPYAFKVEEHWGFKLISETFEEREKCLLGALSILQLPRLSFPVVKKSGYRESFTFSVARQRDVGLIDRAKKLKLRRKPTCEGKTRDYADVGVSSLRPIFNILLVSMIASILLLALELICKIKSKINTICKKQTLICK